jgi:hypothetical protein
MKAQFDRCFDDSTMDAIKRYGLKDLVTAIQELSPDCENSQYAFDVQIRRKSELMVYHGGTCLLTIGLRSIKSGKISFHSKYYGAKGKVLNNNECADVFEKLKKINNIEDMSTIIKLVSDFLFAAERIVDKQKYFNGTCELFWSSRLSIDYGRNWEPNDQWLIIDRESVLGFEDIIPDPEMKKTKIAIYTDDYAEAVKSELHIKHTDHTWAKSSKPFGRELDFLAIDKNHNLVCIELKIGSNDKGISWGPLQTAVYHKAFTKALPQISENIIKLINQKIDLGILKNEAKDRLPPVGFKSVEGVLAVTSPNESVSKEYWERAFKVNSKLKPKMQILIIPEGNEKLEWKPKECK